MFERNRNDYASEPSAVPVEIGLADGASIKGKLLVPAGKSVADALNGPGTFVEFEPYGGDKSFIAKAQLTSVKPVGVPKASNLQVRLNEGDGFDPHRVLGLVAGATREEVRAAYFALAKTYHPDRYATAELPTEVRDYLAAMVRRINAAHAALEAPQKREAARAEAVFTTPGR
jgi:DnaJ-like protein